MVNKHVKRTLKFISNQGNKTYNHSEILILINQNIYNKNQLITSSIGVDVEPKEHSNTTAGNVN